MHVTLALDRDPWHRACFVLARATVVTLTASHVGAH
jgi:hypothetical protein